VKFITRTKGRTETAFYCFPCKGRMIGIVFGVGPYISTNDGRIWTRAFGRILLLGVRF